MWKRGHNEKNRLECEKWVAMWKMAHSLKNGQHCDKWVTVLKMGHTFKKLSQSAKNGSQCEMCLFVKIGSQCENRVIV